MARSVARPLEHVAHRASLRLYVRCKPDTTAPVLELLGEFDIDSVPEIDRFLRRHLGPLYHRQHLVMDLREVTFIDSSFIGFLVRLVRDQRATQRELLLTRPVGQVRRALALVGLPNVVPVFDSVEEAVATLKGEDCELALLHEFPAFETDPESALVKVATAYLKQEPMAVPYATEAAVYAKVNPNILICGPGDTDVAHTADEFVEMVQLDQAVQLYLHLAKTLAQG